MARLFSRFTAVVLCLGLAACGSSGSGTKSSSSPVPKAAAGGAVGAEATSGLLAPAASVENGHETITGQQTPISPQEAAPTDAQRNGVAGAAACATASANPTSGNLASISASIICLLNAERSSAGLAPLALNSKLTKASAGMAALMVKQRFFAHDTPGGRSLVDRIKPTGYIRGNWSLGENLAWGSGSLATPRAIVNSWMHSPGHRANILHAQFKDIGIGIKLGAPQRGLSGGATYVTDFGRH
jgi:uncharacterized protein YkwD